jgi:AcrR family transcriptional regulator
MSSPAVAPLRRHLTDRQADTIGRLVEAAIDEVSETGYDGFTVRNVAKRAGVAPATAYTYFASKEHLLAEVFWRRLQALPDLRIDRRRSPADRVAEAVRDMALLVADEPELSAAVTTAMLAHDPDVKRLRDDIGAVFAERISAALGDDPEPAVLRGLVIAFAGAMLTAGMGNLRYEELPTQMAEIAGLMTRSLRTSRRSS